MATYVLDGRSSAQLERCPLAVKVTTSGAAGGVRLTVRSDSGAPVRLIQTSADLLILPAITESVSIGAAPDHGYERFAAGTVLHVSVSPEGAQSGVPDVAMLAPRDVSGLAFVDLAAIAPAGDRLEITTRIPVPDPPLSQVASAVRIAARGLLGVDRISPAKALAVRAVVDTSTSMAAAFAQQAVAACADIVTGLAPVIGTDASVSYVAPGPRSPGFLRVDDGTLGDLLTRPPAGLGLAPDLRPILGPPVAARTLTVVITDGAGALPALPSDPQHVVATLAISDVHGTAGLPGAAAAVCPLGTGDVRAALASDRPRLNAIVGDLLTPLLRQGVLA